MFLEGRDTNLVSKAVSRARLLTEIDSTLIVGLDGLIIGPVTPVPLHWNFFHASLHPEKHESVARRTATCTDGSTKAT